MRNDDYYMELNESIVLMDKRTEGPGDARFHFHEDYEIFLFLEGDVDLYIEQSVHHMQRGHLAVFNDREIHRACHYGKIPFHRIAIHFHPRLVHGMCTPATNLLGCFQNHRPGKDNVILLSEEQPAAADKTIGAVMDYIDANLSPELSLQSIAACFSIDRYYLSHLFRQQTGSTLYQYILIKKIAAAKQHLLDGKSVTETCYLSGFNDYNNFIRTFKKMTGVSPGHYSRVQRAK